MRRAPDELFEPKKKDRLAPHAFVLDALGPVDPYTRPMFGCTAVYVEDKIVIVLRDRPGSVDNGVWIATTAEHHDSLRTALPSMRSISVLCSGVTGWQVLPAEGEGFEEEAMRAVRMILAGDPRIGKVPKAKKPKAAGAEKKASSAKKRSRP